MAMLLIIAFIAVVLFGIVQWARGGAVLIDIVKLSGDRPAAADEGAEEARTAKNREKEAIRNLESAADSLLRSCFRILGILGLFVLLFVMASVVLDILKVDWMDRLSFHANQLWGNPSARAGSSGSRSGTARSDILRSIGSGLRR